MILIITDSSNNTNDHVEYGTDVTSLCVVLCSLNTVWLMMMSSWWRVLKTFTVYNDWSSPLLTAIPHSLYVAAVLLYCHYMSSVGVRW